MTWKDILVFADGSDNGLARAQMAAALAAEHDAGLEVCIPAAIPAPFASGGTAFASEVIDRVLEGAQEDAASALAAIRLSLAEWRGRLQVETPEVPLSEIPRLAGLLGRSADLVILGQPIAEDASRVDDAILEGALMRSGAPCLMLPRWPAPKIWGRRILVAWKGVREASRAVHDAMPLLARGDAVRIFTVGEGSELDGEGPLGLARLAQHLIRHGVNVEPPVAARAAPAGPAILAQAASWGADLIVMGGYGHSAFRERALGGATRTAIRSSPIAVLLSH